VSRSGDCDKSAKRSANVCTLVSRARLCGRVYGDFKRGRRVETSVRGPHAQPVFAQQPPVAPARIPVDNPLSVAAPARPPPMVTVPYDGGACACMCRPGSSSRCPCCANQITESLEIGEARGVMRSSVVPSSSARLMRHRRSCADRRWTPRRRKPERSKFGQPLLRDQQEPIAQEET
jgi:hypothetical protein